MRRLNLICRMGLPGFLSPSAFLFAAALLNAQSASPSHAPASEATPIAIVALDSRSEDSAAVITGALEVSQGKAIIAANGTITSGAQTTLVTLPHRGLLRVCASTTVKLATDASVPDGEIPGLMMAIDHGAVEASFATGRNSDILLTPDFRILIGGPGAAEVKVRLGQHGDTCVDNVGAPGNSSSSPQGKAAVIAPYVLVTSVFDEGAYRIQTGQRVMFEHGSLRDVVDNEREPCGCPPAAPHGNEFPLAQSEGLAPLPKAAPSAVNSGAAPSQPLEPLVYSSASHAPQPAAAPPAADDAKSPNNPPATKKSGFIARVGRFFRRIFGAE